MLPASFFSSQNPNKVLATRTLQIKGNPLLRKTLITFQFMITVGMLIATAVVYYQYQFIKNYDRGYNVESVLAVPKYNMKPETYQSLKTALLDHNNIHGIGASSLVFPGALQSSINYRAKGSDGEQKSMKAVRTDGDFFELFNIKLNSGKAFPEKYEAERPMVILNHEAAKLLSWDNPEDKWFELMHLEKRAEVLGFVHDINFESLKNEVVPTVYLFDPADSHIMYLRLGWVVGNAGVLGAWTIILLSYLITLCTALSMSSITTNIRIGAGGAYAIISQALGLEVGGSLGIPRYISQGLAVTMYIFGFREGWLSIFPDHPAFVIDLVVFIVLYGIAYKSADLAIKTQYIIMAVVGVSRLTPPPPCRWLLLKSAISPISESISSLKMESQFTDS